MQILRLVVFASLFLGAARAEAGANATQGRFDIDKGGGIWTFKYSYADEASRTRRLEFSLPADKIRHDNDVSLTFPKGASAKAQVAAIRTYAEGRKGMKIKAQATKSGGVQIGVSGRASEVQATMAGAKAAAGAAADEFLARHKYTRLRDGGIVPDHARLAELYADEVGPLAAAIANDAPDGRTYVARALAFVQAIPYESGNNGKDRGYRRPLSVIARNKGDCDSKSALFLALVRAQHPELATTVVYIPNHVFAGVAFAPGPGERSFVRDGVKYVGLEPVGPAKNPVGKVSGPSGWHLFWGSVEARALPAAR